MENVNGNIQRLEPGQICCLKVGFSQPLKRMDYNIIDRSAVNSAVSDIPQDVLGLPVKTNLTSGLKWDFGLWN